MALILAGPADAKILNVREAPFSAIGDGTTDDRPALASALSAAQPNDTVLIPGGSYRIILTGGPMRIPDGVTIWGQGESSKLLLSSNGDETAHREFLRPGSDVTIQGLTVERATEFSGILFPISGDANNITFRNCHIIGNQKRFPQRACHAFRVGFGVVKNLNFDSITIEDCCYGLFQPNDATGTLDGVTVKHCRFKQNTASDLEFNSPKGVMRNIEVRDCYFRDNRCQTPGGGFAVGFANVTKGRVERCDIRNYGSEALHVEDRSADIRLVGNTIVAGSVRQPNGVILVINDSRQVTIERNFIDARDNTNSPHLILVTAGGTKFKNPSDVFVTANVLVNGPTTRTWYLQNGSGDAPSGNLVVPAAGSAEK